MVLLAAAVLFYFTFHRKAVLNSSDNKELKARIVATVSISLWLGVGIAGRAIGLI